MILYLHHTLFCDVRGGVRWKRHRVLQALHLQALTQPEGIREVYTEEVIPEWGFEG